LTNAPWCYRKQGARKYKIPQEFATSWGCEQGKPIKVAKKLDGSSTLLYFVQFLLVMGFYEDTQQT
jgi:hypothetical protein